MPANPHQTAEEFQSSLQKMEGSRNVDDLLGLFSDDVELANLGSEQGLKGIDGARHFWETYLAQFTEVHSDFEEPVTGEGGAVLVWKSRGTLATGQLISYAGVSILRLDEVGKVARFRTIYDSAAFIAKVAEV